MARYVCGEMMEPEMKCGAHECLISKWERSHSLETDLMTCYNGGVTIGCF